MESNMYYLNKSKKLEKFGLTPIFIGLPGAGKSTYSEAFKEILNKQVVSTDKLFRVYRQVGSLNEGNEKSAVMKNFLEEAKKMIGKNVNPDNKEVRIFTKANYAKLYEYATSNKLATEISCDLKEEEGKIKIELAGKNGIEADNDSKPCILKSSCAKTGFRSFGEHIFRLYEIEMNKYLVKKGEFEGKIPDLSASALLYPENKEIFSPKNGYIVILVDTPKERLIQNLINDYNEQNSLEVGEIKNIRGAYEGVVNSAFEEYLKENNIKINPSKSRRLAVMEFFKNNENRNQIIKEALTTKSQEDRDFRMEKYKKNAMVIIDPIKENGKYKTEEEVLVEIMNKQTVKLAINNSKDNSKGRSI
jgi:hypothetical protein